MYDFSTKKRTHGIVVRAVRGQKDNVMFSINCNIDINKILKKFIEGNLNKILKNEIIFTNEEKITSTHRIVVEKVGKKTKYRTFSVNFPTYSSKEIANEISKHLCGGKENV